MVRKQRLVVKLMLIAVVSIAVTAVALTAVGVIQLRETYLTLIEEELKVAAVQLEDEIEKEYDGDWTLNGEKLRKGPNDVTEIYLETMDDLHSRTGIDYTIFFDKTRRLTTLTKSGSSERIVGTDAADVVVEKVLKGGGEYLAANIEIEGKTYYGYYVPLKNPDGSIIGMTFSGRESGDVMSTIIRSAVIMSVIALVCVIIVVIIGVGQIRSSSKVMKNIVGSLRSLSEGNLNVKIISESLKRKDELGIIAESTQILDEKLRDVIEVTKKLSDDVMRSGNNLSTSSEQANETSSQVVEAVDEISKGAVSQADGVRNSVNNTEDIGHDIDGISGNIGELTKYAESMRSACDATMSALGELLNQNVQVVESMKVIDEQIRSTNNAVKDIAEASDIITDISSQTNLLSLNASIEAARAGEVGKGFAVVATEIGSLADQSGEAAVKINQIVQTLVAESEKSVETVEKLNEGFEQQNERLESTRSDLDSMAKDVRMVAESSDGISRQIDNLTGAKESLIRIIEDLSAISEENAAATEETNASVQDLSSTFATISDSASELKSLAIQLNEKIDFFTIG